MSRQNNFDHFPFLLSETLEDDSGIALRWSVEPGPCALLDNGFDGPRGLTSDDLDALQTAFQDY
jgi:hypothetical protein